jgi:hypothetical protein
MLLYSVHFPIPQSLEEALIALKVAQQEIKTICLNSKSLHDQSMADKARDLAATGKKDQAAILDQMWRKEQQAECWK